MNAALLPAKQDGQDRTEEIYVKAAQIFYERGYDATSMNDVAKELEITKAGLYYYIESKEDLLFRIINYGLDWLDREVVGPAKAVPDAEERLRFIIQRHGGELIKGAQAIPILSDQSACLSPKLRKQVDKRKRVYFDVVKSTLSELKEQGKLQDVDLTVAAFGLFGMILWLPRWFSSDGPLSADQALTELTKLYFNGLMLGSTKGKRVR